MMEHDRDELIGRLLTSAEVPEHTPGFHGSLHQALVLASPVVSRFARARRIAGAVALAAFTLLFAGGAAWAIQGLTAVRRPPAHPIVVPVPQPRFQERLRVPHELEDPPQPTGAEARRALIGDAASRRLPPAVLEAKVAFVVKAGRAWWVGGWVRPGPDAEVRTDPLIVVLHRDFTGSRWQHVYSGTGLSQKCPLPPELADAPSPVPDLVRKKILNGVNPFPPEHTEKNARKLAPSAAESFVMEKHLTSAEGAIAGTRLHLVLDGRDTWWASVRVDVKSNAGETLYWTIVYMQWRPKDVSWQYVTSGKNVDRSRLPAEVRARL